MRHLWRDIRALPRAIQGLLFSVFLSRTGTFVSTFLVLYLTQVFHLTVAEASKVMGIFGAGSIIATIVGGIATDRLGSRRVLLVGYCGNALAILGLLLQTRLGPLFAAIFCCGFTVDLARPASTTLISHYLSGSLRVKTYSLHHIMMNLGWIVGPMIGSMLIGFSFTALFAWNIVIVCGCGVIAWRMVVDPVQQRNAHEEEVGTATHAEPLRIFPFVLAMGIQVISGAFIIQSTVSLPLYIRDVLHLPTWCYGATVSWNGLGVVLLGYPVANFMSRRRAFLGTGWGLFIFGLGTAMYALARTFPGLLIAETVLTVGEVMYVGIFQNLVAQLSPVHLRGKLFGISHAVMAGSMLVTPVAAGFLLEHVSFTTFWPLFGGLGIVTLALATLGQHLTHMPPANILPTPSPTIESMEGIG